MGKKVLIFNNNELDNTEKQKQIMMKN